MRQDHKNFIKVSPNDVGVKNYRSCIVQSADVDQAKISGQESSPRRRKCVIFPQAAQTHCSLFWDSIAYYY